MAKCDCCNKTVITKQGMPGILGTFCLQQENPNDWAGGPAIQTLDSLSQQLEAGDYLVLFDGQVTGDPAYDFDYYLELNAVEIADTRKKEAETISATPHSAHIGLKKCITVPAGGGLLEVKGEILAGAATFAIGKTDLIILKLS